MSAETPEPREVPIDILPPLPPDAVQVRSPEATPPLSGWRTFYHPASGVVILGIDLLVFGSEVVSDFLDTPIMCVLAFAATFPLVFLIQWKWSRNSALASFGKAFLGAFLAGLPFSIAGTIYGAAVIALSGLPKNHVEAYHKLADRWKAQKLPKA
jgi:hypothetical protein